MLDVVGVAEVDQGSRTHAFTTHTWLCGHAWQVTMPPQPSSITPHLAPAASQVFDLQPHRLGPPAPPQV
jgi:hypothetical protein